MTATQPTLLDGRYRLIAPIGAGGMSVIWRGVDELLARPIAVKVLTSVPTGVSPGGEATDRIRREAMALAKINHPYIANVFDYGVGTGPEGSILPYIVMELVEGSSLSAVLRNGPLSWPTVAGIGAQAAAALAAAHRYGVIHGDVTPANIMLGTDGVKVIDFGVSSSPGQEVGDQIFGTPPYLAPERISGAPAQPATDVYGLGIVLYQALAGRLPWPEAAGRKMLEIRRSTPPAPLPSIPGLPPRFAHLCQQTIATDPAARPPSEILSTELSAIARAGDPRARPVPAAPVPPLLWDPWAPDQQQAALSHEAWPPRETSRRGTRVLPHGVADLPDPQAATIAIGASRRVPARRGGRRAPERHGTNVLPAVLLMLLVGCLTWASLHPGDPGAGDAGAKPRPSVTTPNIATPAPTRKPAAPPNSDPKSVPGSGSSGSGKSGSGKSGSGSSGSEKSGSAKSGSGKSGKKNARRSAPVDEPTAYCQVNYQALDQWVYGFTAQITIVNTGTEAFRGWTLRFDLDPGQQVGSGWNAVWHQDGRTVTVTSAGSTLPAGGRVTVGFLGTEAGTASSPPQHFTLNGQSCR